MRSTNYLFVSVEETQAVIQAVWRHAGLDLQTREDNKWNYDG